MNPLGQGRVLRLWRWDTNRTTANLDSLEAWL